jgi:hypothetical protein
MRLAFPDYYKILIMQRDDTHGETFKSPLRIREMRRNPLAKKKKGKKKKR